MNLAKLLSGLESIQVVGEAENKEIESIAFDSRKVNEKSIFVAIKGLVTDGHGYIPDVLSKNVPAIIMDNNSAVAEHLIEQNNSVKILVKDSRVALAQISDLLFNQPSKKIKLIGITGTKGKTTTAFFLKNILEESGAKVGLIGTMKNMIGREEFPTDLTTPESNTINSLMRKMVDAGCEYCVMEVSSHSLTLHRVDFLDFDAAIFTNLASDHMDFHKNHENYLKAKKILFDKLKSNGLLIYNLDDQSAAEIIRDSNAEKFSYGQNDKSDVKLKSIEYDFEGTKFSIESNEKIFNLSTNLIGTFNAYNAVAAFTLARQIGIEPEDAKSGIETMKQIPGRFEVIKSGEKIVIVDFSHTANSLEQALLALNKIAENYQPRKKVYTVFGCGGNRDKLKRPEMGKIATNLSEKVFVTSDNPRFEDPFIILKDIEDGIELDNYEVIENRELAIKKAIDESEDNAVVLIAGKGHENYQLVNGEKTHFSDRETAEKFLIASTKELN